MSTPKYNSVYGQEEFKNGKFVRFILKIDSVRTKYGYWRFHSDEDDVRAYEQGVRNPESFILAAANDSDNYFYQDVTIRWVAGDLDPFPYSRIGTARQHIQHIVEERNVLGLSASFRSGMPVYAVDTSSKLLEHRQRKHKDTPQDWVPTPSRRLALGKQPLPPSSSRAATATPITPSNASISNLPFQMGYSDALRASLQAEPRPNPRPQGPPTREQRQPGQTPQGLQSNFNGDTPAQTKRLEKQAQPVEPATSYRTGSPDAGISRSASPASSAPLLRSENEVNHGYGRPGDRNPPPRRLANWLRTADDTPPPTPYRSPYTSPYGSPGPASPTRGFPKKTDAEIVNTRETTVKTRAVKARSSKEGFPHQAHNAQASSNGIEQLAIPNSKPTLCQVLAETNPTYKNAQQSSASIERSDPTHNPRNTSDVAATVHGRTHEGHPAGLFSPGSKLGKISTVKAQDVADAVAAGSKGPVNESKKQDRGMRKTQSQGQILQLQHADYKNSKAGQGILDSLNHPNRPPRNQTNTLQKPSDIATSGSKTEDDCFQQILLQVPIYGASYDPFDPFVTDMLPLSETLPCMDCGQSQFHSFDCNVASM